METIPCWITFCHKSSISSLFAEDREDGTLNKGTAPLQLEGRRFGNVRLP
jgi:hypothetical protein